MKFARALLFLLAALLAGAAVWGCKTNEQGELVPDWVDNELDAAVDDLRDLQVAYPDHADEYSRIALDLIEVDAVVEALAAGGEIDFESARGQVDILLAATAPFKEEEWAVLLRAVLRRLRNYLPAS